MSEESNFLSRVLLVDYPASSEYTRSAIKRAAAKVLPDWRVVTCLPDEQICALQFSDYDSLRFEWAMQEPTRCMLNAYVIRKVRAAMYLRRRMNQPCHSKGTHPKTSHADHCQSISRKAS